MSTRVDMQVAVEKRPLAGLLVLGNIDLQLLRQIAGDRPDTPPATALRSSSDPAPD